MAAEPPLRLLLVDDEPPARQRLRRLLAAQPEVAIVGEAGDGLQALALAEQLRPDALLLDVQMPEVGGLDVAASLGDDGPAVVFVTAFDRYALQAFDAAAVDYLLKPVEPERLALALQRLRTPRGPRKAAARRPPPQRLVFAERGRIEVLPVAGIDWLQAADNYVQVHAGGCTRLLRRTLAGLLQDLGPAFQRIHRSAAVALAQVEHVSPLGKGDAEVRLRSGARLRCSRAHRAALAAALQHGA